MSGDALDDARRLAEGDGGVCGVAGGGAARGGGGAEEAA